MEHDIERIVISERQLAARVRDMAGEIAAAYPDQLEGLTLVTILSGSIVFLADLIRQLPIKMKIGLITVSSYPGKTSESADTTIVQDLNVDTRDRHVLLIDDILDTGKTIRAVRNRIEKQQPKSVKVAVLLRKPSKTPPDVRADFIGFDIEDEFVVGYGLDYDDHYRNLPHIAVLKPELY